MVVPTLISSRMHIQATLGLSKGRFPNSSVIAIMSGFRGYAAIECVFCCLAQCCVDTPLLSQELLLYCVLQDWDVFYLAASCCQILGQNVSRHLVPVFGTAGAMAYMMTPAFARKAVRAASDPRLNTWVDLVLQVRALPDFVTLSKPACVF